LKRAASLCALLCALALAPAFGVTQSQTLLITASVPANCVVGSHMDVDFGVYNPAAQTAPLDVTANALQVACTKGASGVRIALGNGLTHRGAHRQMTRSSGPGALQYDIYTSPARSTVWNQINTVSYTSQTNQPVTLAFYGRINGGQQAPPGTYLDTVLAMVNF